MANIDDVIRKKLGIPLENVAGYTADQLQKMYDAAAKLAAINKISDNPMATNTLSSQLPSPPPVNKDEAAAKSLDYQMQQDKREKRLKQEAAGQQAKWDEESNFDPNSYTTYPHQGNNYADGGMTDLSPLEKAKRAAISRVKEMSRAAYDISENSADKNMREGYLKEADKAEKQAIQYGKEKKDLKEEDSMKILPVDAKTQNEQDGYSLGGFVKHDPDLNKPKFSHLKNLQASHKKAMSELEASRNPMRFIEKSKNMSIKGKKGIAF